MQICIWSAEVYIPMKLGGGGGGGQSARQDLVATDHYSNMYKVCYSLDNIQMCCQILHSVIMGGVSGIVGCTGDSEAGPRDGRRSITCSRK